MADLTRREQDALVEKLDSAEKSRDALRAKLKVAEVEGDEFTATVIRGTLNTMADYGGAALAGRFVVDRKFPKTPIPIAVLPGAVGTILDATGMSMRWAPVDAFANFLTMQLKAEVVTAMYKRRLARAAATP
jgi:IMP cyclohydrolase